MINGNRVLGLITARGGSKGLPGKNLRILCGKPLLAWTAEAGTGSRYIDHLVLTTDSDEIANAGKALGIAVPFLRPPELATDTATSIDVAEHALQFLRDTGQEFDTLVLLEPTSPLRESKDIDLALEQMLACDAESVVSVCQAESTHPAFMFRRGENARLESAQPGGFAALRRQDLEPMYFLEGTVYASRVQALLRERSFCHRNTVGFEVPKWKSPEIDDIVDFLHVEAIMIHRGIG